MRGQSHEALFVPVRKGLRGGVGGVQHTRHPPVDQDGHRQHCDAARLTCPGQYT